MESETVAQDIASLQEEPMSKLLPFRYISDRLYFVDPKILKLYLKNNRSDSFLDSFFSIEQAFQLKTYFRNVLENDHTYGLGNSSKFKSVLSAKYGSFSGKYVQLKSAYERLFSHHYYSAHYQSSFFSLSVGDLRLKNGNPLFFADSYGSFLYEFQRYIHNRKDRVSGRSGITSQNTVRGISVEYKGLHVLYGYQNYASSQEKSIFTSFNFYQPMVSERLLALPNVKERIAYMRYHFNLGNNMNVNVAYLASGLSATYVKSSFYQSLNYSKGRFLGFSGYYTNSFFRLRANYAYSLENASAYEVGILVKENRHVMEMKYFFYSPFYLNPHSLAFLDGTSFALNRKGLYASYSFFLHKKIRVYLASMYATGVAHYDDVFSESKRNHIVSLVSKLSFGTFYFSYKGNTRYNASLKFKKGMKLKIRYHGEINAMCFLVDKEFSVFDIAVGISKADRTFRVYRNGFKGEFLSHYLKGTCTFLNFFWKHDFGWATLNINYMTTYRFDASGFGSGDTFLNTKLKNEIGLFFQIRL